MNESQEKLFAQVASIAANFGPPARLKIIYILGQAPRSVESIAQITGESVANTSQHLQRLASETVALLAENLFDLAEELHTLSFLSGTGL